ncbi:fucose-specific lectin [Nemania abortiva]|nr:fucose-specific lectin [Nemania abortiva]
MAHIRTQGDQASEVLDGSNVASTVTGQFKCKIYYQDIEGVIAEYTYDEQWKPTTSATFSAKLYSPLAAISFNSGQEIRVYCISEEGYLQDWVYSSSRSGWTPGGLSQLKSIVAANTGLAAVCWSDNGPKIRVYAQDPTTNKIQEYRYDTSWTKGAELAVAQIGTSLAAVCVQQNGINLRVYYQAPDKTISEYRSDSGGPWYQGTLKTDEMPALTSIAATGWYNSDVNVRVFFQDSSQNIIAYKWEGEWSLDSTVIGPLRTGRRISALEWNVGDSLRVFYQADDNRIREQSQTEGGPWTDGGFVSG